MTEGKMISANLEMGIAGNKLKLKLVVPVNEVPPESLLPSLHQLTNQIMDGLERKIEQTPGAELSCKKGCGACCRQYVPISPAEARHLSVLIEEMPEERKRQIKSRFKEAALALQDSGLLHKAMYYGGMTEEATLRLVNDYFKLGIACPFLEEESCSIHMDRPLICREYLVISSPEHCATLNSEKIKRLNIPVSISEKFGAMDGVSKSERNPYLPLIMALEWVERYPDDAEYRPGTSWV
jgi:Fe-S-cluster containining protein